MLKKKWVRWVLALGFLLFVLLPLTLLLVAWIFIDPIGEKLIETGGTEALGVKTEVGNFHCSILTGSVAINQLTIDNPTGFDPAQKALNLSHVATGVSIGSLTGDTIEIKEMTIDGLLLNLEADDKTTNVQTLMANAQSRAGGNATPPPTDSAAPAPAPAAAGPEKRFKIALIHLAHIRMELKTSWPVASKNAYEIPAFEMKDLWRADGQGYTASELLVEILNRATKAGLAIGGKDLQDQLKQRLLAELDQAGARFKQQATDAAKQAGEDLKQDAAAKAQDALNNALTGGKDSAKDAGKDAGKDLKNDLNKLKNPFK